jgi:hypothetical protein
LSISRRADLLVVGARRVDRVKDGLVCATSSVGLTLVIGAIRLNDVRRTSHRSARSGRCDTCDVGAGGGRASWYVDALTRGITRRLLARIRRNASTGVVVVPTSTSGVTRCLHAALWGILRKLGVRAVSSGVLAGSNLASKRWAHFLSVNDLVSRWAAG